MNFLSRFRLFLQSESFYKSLYKEDFKNTATFVLIITVILAIILNFTIINDISNYIGIEENLTTSLLIITFIGTLTILSLIFTFFVNLYNKISLTKTTKIFLNSLFPLYLTLILIMLPKVYDFLFKNKPVLLLLIVLYSLYLTHKGLKSFKMNGGNATASIVLFIVFIYIIALRKIDVIIFYSVVMAWLFYKRNKFTKQGSVLMYKTKLGLKSMEITAKKYPRLMRILGDIGIYLGFFFMIVIVIILIENAISLLFVPSTMPGVSPVLPGIPIPGAPIFLPLWYGIISIFITVLIHEFSHGVIARLYDIKVKSSGFLFIGPIIGAFVEPDEKQMEKKPKKQQLAVLGAGPFSNILLALIVILLLQFAIAPLMNSTLVENGVSINVLSNHSADLAGLETGMVITEINNNQIDNDKDFLFILENSKPNEEINLKNYYNESFIAILGTHPEHEDRGYLGINAKTNFEYNPELIEKYSKIPFNLLMILQRLLTWLFIISFGIGVANLIPLGPVDGGRMLLIVLTKYFKKEKAKLIWTRISAFSILLLLFVLLFPLFRWISGQLI